MAITPETRQWKAISKSEIGISHQKRKQPCQDYGNYLIEGGFLIGAVADGAGSAKYADIGAKETVTFMINYFQKMISKSKKIFNNNNLSTLAIDISLLPQTKVKSIFITAIKRLQIKLQKIAEANNCSLKDLACTLILFIADQKGIYAMQIGDGFLVIHSPKKDYQLVFLPKKGEYQNETVFVTCDDAIASMQTTIIEGNYSFICASTDGLESVALKLPNYTPFAPFFQPLQEYIFQTQDPEKEETYLINFLKFSLTVKSSY